MCLDDSVEEISANEAEIAINCGEGTLDEGPVLGIKVGEIGMRVVQVSNSNWEEGQFMSKLASSFAIPRHSPSQWCTQK